MLEVHLGRKSSFNFYLLHNFFIPLVLILFLVLGFKGRRCERRYKVPEDVMKGGGLDDVAQQPVESLGGEKNTHTLEYLA